MANRYNFNAERAADVNVSPTRKQRDSSWELTKEREPNPWSRGQLQDVPDRPPKLPPRVIRVELDSSRALSVEDNSVTWLLSLPVGPLADNTVLHWRDMVTNQTEAVDWALSGISAHSYNLGGARYTLRGRFVNAGGDYWPLTATTPLSVSILDKDALNNRQVTLTRLGATGAGFKSIAGFYVRLQLVFVEPGANVYSS